VRREKRVRREIQQQASGETLAKDAIRSTGGVKCTGSGGEADRGMAV
jgi:hypothetical protein